MPDVQAPLTNIANYSIIGSLLVIALVALYYMFRLYVASQERLISQAQENKEKVVGMIEKNEILWNSIYDLLKAGKDKQ